MDIAASSATVGHLGLGGAALALSAVAFLGTRQKADHALKPPAAYGVGAAAGTCYAAAGEPWAMVSDTIGSVLRSAGIGSGSGPFGDAGAGAAAVVVTSYAVFVAHRPRGAAYTGIIAATVYAGAGGVWTQVADALGGIVTGFSA